MPFVGSANGFGYGRLQSGNAYYNTLGKAQWAALLDSTGTDEVRSMVCDYSYNLYVTGLATPNATGVRVYDASGITQRLTSFAIPQLGGTLGFSAKYGPSGNCQWVSAVDTGTTSEYNYNISIDNQQNIYVAGTTLGNTLFWDPSGFTVRQSPLIFNRGRSSYIYKMNSNGVVQWVTGFPANAAEGFFCATDSENNICYGGAYQVNAGGTITLLDASGTTQSDSLYTIPQGNNTWSYYLIKLNSDGKTQWGLNIPTAGLTDTTVGDLAIDKANNIYIGGLYSNAFTYRDASGFTQSNTLFSVPQPSGSPFRLGAYLAKYNSSGKMQWNTYFDGTTAGEETRGIVTDSQCNVYWTISYNNTFGGTFTVLDASGTTQRASPFTIPQPPAGNATALIKYNPNGICQWATYINGPGGDFGFTIRIDSLDNLYICGQTDPVTLQMFDASGTTQRDSGVTCTIPINTAIAGFLAKYNSNGKCQWATYISGTNTAINTTTDWWFGIAIDRSNSVYVGGGTSGIATVRDTSGNTQSNTLITITSINTTNTGASFIKYR